MILNLYAYFVLFFWTSLTIYLVINSHKLRFLRNEKLQPDSFTPPVSIIVAVRNEEAALADALETLCNIDHPDYELIVVNDRSTDNSGSIIQTIQKKYSHLQTVTIEELPAGWLGKNHALYQGYLKSKHEWILFTDADIHFSKNSLRKAFSYAHKNNLDHLTILPEVYYSSVWLKIMLVTFQIMLEIKLRPWAVKNKRSKASIGVGAFNLVKKKVYENIGTHEVISLRPDDDLKLGEKIKHAGYHSDVCYGDGEIKLEWYKNVKELINGLMKNSFSAFNYQTLISIGSVFSLVFLFSLPAPILLIFGNTEYRIIACALILVQIILFTGKPAMKAKWYEAMLMPWAAMMMAYIIAKATYLTLKQNGIYWRDTFYSLKELKKQR